MKSFSMLRTHTGLSTNIKVMVDSLYNLYLESIDSDPELSASRFKKSQFNKDNYYDELVPYFFKDFPVDIAFSIFYGNDNSSMSTDFANQYDDLYLMGARNIIDNKNYKEEFEYFAPLYVFKHHIPKYFAIFRVDGPGLVNLTKDNFRSEFLKNFKAVKVFDLTKNTVLGEWIDNNFKNNGSFPTDPLDVDFRELEFTKWIGIDYETGGYTYKSFYMEENLENENTLFDFELSFVDGYRSNKIIFPHILNFSFLFDDTPATPTSLRKWSLNRYSGFYLEDLEVIDSITPFKMPELRSDVVVDGGNVIYSTVYGDPFLNGFQDDSDMWIEYLGDFYKVEKFEETLSRSVNPVNVGTKRKRVLSDDITNPVVTRYRIISDLDLTGNQSIINTRHCFINSQNQIVKVSNNSSYSISDFSFADVNLINIDGVYHNLIEENGYTKLVTDYGFKYQDNSIFEYYINSGLPGYSNTIDLLITKNNKPKSFKIYRAKFTDIKDFDTQIVDSDFSKFEYEKRNDLSKTEEGKMYLTDLRSKNNPPDFDDFLLNGKTEYIPVSSDYTANLETFRVSDGALTDLWRKNPIHCRWGYQNSISTNDRPYLLNNNDVHENFNRAVDTQNSISDRPSRNLDYFYTINSGTTSYLHHSLHVEKNIGNVQDTSLHFELDKYLGLAQYTYDGSTFSYDFDYFDLFFGSTQSFIDGEVVLNKKKYSYIESGDNTIPNTTVFRGLKFRLFEVDNIKQNPTSIDKINLFTSDEFIDYKFSVLLSSNDYMVDDDGELYKPYHWDYFIDNQYDIGTLSFLTSTMSSPSDINIGDYIEIDQFYPYTTPSYQSSPLIVATFGSLDLGGYGFVTNVPWTTSSPVQPGIYRNKMQWEVIKNWELDRSYDVGDLVMWDDVIFEVTNGATISDPSMNPFISVSYFSPFDNWVNSIFYPGPFLNYTRFFSNTYGVGEWVYRYNEYYYCTNTTPFSTTPSGDFWIPYVSYIQPSIVIYDSKLYQLGTASSAGSIPTNLNYWNEISEQSMISVPKWKKVELWDKNLSYTLNTLVVYNDILYSSGTYSTTRDDAPGESIKWGRLYSFVPDTEYKYASFYYNPVIKISDSYYHCMHNPSELGNSPFYSSSKNPGNLTLDNGITIYINKKWKNILVNIAINDNTISSTSNIPMDKTRNVERDDLYVESNGRLTAANFIKQINDLDTLYGFADYTSYVVIEEDGSIKKYHFDNKIEDLPYMLLCEEPDNFNLKNNTLKYTSNSLNKDIIKSYRYLINGNIDNLEKIDFYNEVPLGVVIENIKDDPKILKNLNNQDNSITQSTFRHSGYYMPIFYDIDLFESTSIYDSGLKCDCSILTDWNVYGVCIGTSSYDCRYVYANVEFQALIGATFSFNSDFVEITEPGGYGTSSYVLDNGIITIDFSPTTMSFFEDAVLEIEDDCKKMSISGYDGDVNIIYYFSTNSPDRSNCRVPLITRSGNYIFDDSLSLFGVVKQRTISKINRNEDILKLRNNDTYDSIYPMLDEFGYMVADFFIFKSTWDFEYHIESNKPVISSVPTLQNIYQTLYIQGIVKKYNSI